MEELLLLDVCSSSSLFDEDGLSATKSNIVQELQKGKSPKGLPPRCMKTGYIVDVMGKGLSRTPLTQLHDYI